MNTKHEVSIGDKCSAQLKTSIKIIKHMPKCQEKGKTYKFMVICVTKQSKTLNNMNKSPI